MFITAELATRERHSIGAEVEKRALQDLAIRMAESPELVLPRFVELAMELTGGSSAGLSLFEEGNGSEPEGVFRWHHVFGSLAAFSGATTPRNYSPCGVTLDCATPVLTRHSERLYSWISDAGIIVPEVLLVPLFFGGQHPLGTLWIVKEEVGLFNADDARVATELATFVGIAVRMQRDRASLESALAAQATLAGEMSHRVKNLFALTDSMIRFSARGAATPAEMASTLSGRVRALSQAHALVVRGISEDGAVSDLASLVEAVSRPYEDHAERRVSVRGPLVLLGEKAVSGIALCVHELTTNALKYGALAADHGRLVVEWLLDNEQLRLQWIESGGPEVSGEPSSSGFGSTLIRTTVTSQFAGEINYEWRPEGLKVAISIPRAKLTN